MPALSERQCCAVEMVELHVRQTALHGAGARVSDESGVDVDAVHRAVAADHVGQRKAEESGTAAEVEHPLPRRDAGRFEQARLFGSPDEHLFVAREAFVLRCTFQWSV